MDRDTIIRMAREAGFAVRKFGDKDQVMEGDNYHIQTDEIERFAALVTEHEREYNLRTLAILIDAAVVTEREACAKVCEEPGWNAAKWCADRIRARGQE